MPIRRTLPNPQLDWNKRLNGYFIAFCRKAFRWNPAYRAALKEAFVEKREGKEFYRCKDCGNVVERSEKQVDHIEPVIPIGNVWNGDWNEYRQRCFVTSEKLQVLCKACHRRKTGRENTIRRKTWKSQSKKKSASRRA